MRKPPSKGGFVVCRGGRLGSTFSSGSTRPEAGEDVVAIRREEVPIRRPGDPRARRPAAAAQHLACAELRLRIVRVGIGRELREEQEIRRRPFPDVADHLPAAERAVGLGAGGDVDWPVESMVQIVTGGRGRRIAQGYRRRTPAIGLGGCWPPP